jgi:hypothetical protein
MSVRSRTDPFVLTIHLPVVWLFPQRHVPGGTWWSRLAMTRPAWARTAPPGDARWSSWTRNGWGLGFTWTRLRGRSDWARLTLRFFLWERI